LKTQLIEYQPLPVKSNLVKIITGNNYTMTGKIFPSKLNYTRESEILSGQIKNIDEK
jgi:hypothetical protein